MERDLNNFDEWLKANRLSLNLNKTKSMIFHKNKTDASVKLSIRNTDIEQVQNTKFLGITIDSNLNWAEHIKSVCNKLASVNSLLYRSREFLDKKSLIKLYNTLALPHLSYCNAIWGGDFSSHLKPLKVIQKRIIRTINHALYREHTLPLFKNQKSLTLEDIHNTELLKIAYQLQNDTIPHQFKKFNIKNCQYHQYNTRGKNNFTVKKYKMKKSQNTSVIFNAKKCWNMLDEDTKCINKYNKFKRKVKQKILDSY